MMSVFDISHSERPRGWLRERPIARTTLEVMVLAILKMGMIYAFWSIGVEAGAASAQAASREYADQIFVLLALMCLIGPLTEELVFRGPAALLNLFEVPTGFYWICGIVASLSFAAAHGLEMLPVTQFIGGLYYWWLTRERGLPYAIYGHMLNNALSVGAGLALASL